MDKQETEALTRCLQTARDSGAPIDQAKQFIDVSYIPLPWQWEFHAAAREADSDGGPVDIGLGGARGPGKSHAVLSQAGLDDCQRVPGLKGLFLRQTGVAAKESFDDLVDKVIVGHVPYERTGSLLKFGNGSRIVLGGFKDANDIDKYIGIEYDLIIVEELDQLTEEKYTKLRGSLRTSKPNWRPRIYTSFNPGGIGHAFVKDRYIMPLREKRQKEPRFIGSTYKSNPYLNKEYIEYLEDLKGDLGRAWREGDWDLFKGQVFNEFRREKHVIPSLTPKAWLQQYLSFDWGYRNPFAAYAHTLIEMKTTDGVAFKRLVTWREWYGIEKNPGEWAEMIYKSLSGSGILKITGAYADPSMCVRVQDGGLAVSDQMQETWQKQHGRFWVQIQKALNKRIPRIAIMHDWLSEAPDGMPYWVITEDCPNLIRTLPLLVYDDSKLEDIDTLSEDHGYDSCGYLQSMLHYRPGKPGTVRRTPALVGYQGLMAVDESHIENPIDPSLFETARPTGDWRSV
jgi:phage terminase large subunit